MIHQGVPALCIATVRGKFCPIHPRGNWREHESL
jgi:hypothetical protein